jgi:hypothetical protein
VPGFRCRHNPAQAATQFHQLFQRIGLTREQFESPAYTRLAMLRQHLGQGRLDRELFWKG